MQWLIGINALKFFAIILIIIYHFFRNILPGGFIAVEIFFTISGFLIFTKLIQTFAKNRRLSYGKFILTRLARLLPTLLICIALTLILSFCVHPDVLAGTRWNTLAALTFTTNIKELITGGAYENTISPNLFEHTWFLALEFQFYLLAPLLVIFVMGSFKQNRRGARILGITLLILAIASTALMAIYGGLFNLPNRAYFALDSHFAGFCLGGALAVFNYLVPRTPRTQKIIPATGLILSLTIITILAFKLTFGSNMTYYFGLPFTGILTVIMLFCIIKLQPNIHVRRRSTIPLQLVEKLGGYSYGLYLFHWPLYLLLPNILPAQAATWLAPILNLIISFTLAYLCAQYLHSRRTKLTVKASHWRRCARAVCILTLLVPSIFALLRIPNVSSITAQLQTMQDSATEPTRTIAALDYVGIAATLDQTQQVVFRELDTTADRGASDNAQAPHAATSANSAQVLVIGDSVTLGAKQALEATIDGVYVDALESRGIWTARNLLANYAAAGRLPDTIVISLITNEFTITDNLLQGIVDSAGAGHNFVFVTGYAGPQQPRETQNQALKNYINNHPNVYLADWWELAHNNWSLMYADHIHLNPEGRSAYANLLNNVIRSIKR